MSERDQEDSKNIGRREILKTMAAGLALGGCSAKASDDRTVHLSEASAAQRARKIQGRSSIAIIKVASYEEDIFARIKPFIKLAALPSLQGQTVVIKPNIVEIQPGHPITTNPAMVKAAIELVDYLGAKKVIVAEGPGHMRDTELLLLQSGIGPLLDKMGIPFVDLNLDDVVAKANPDNFSGLDPVWLPETIATADAVISLPKMKTHHWVGMTCSMKNLFGTFPGRKYGWPKNTLHLHGIPNCVIDINQLVKPKFALVDAIVAMEGDGPIAGTGVDTGYVVLGCDLAAVDATCARAMNFKPEEMTYIARAGQVLGNIDEKDIDVHGASVAEVKRDFTKPVTYYNKQLLAESANSGS
jgi:uncharacterized protein (DUF362 family)